NDDVVIPLDEVQLDDKLHFVEKPEEIIDREMELPDKLRKIHDTFHVSNLKRCFMNDDVVIPLDEVQLDDKLHFDEKPEEIIDREVKRLKIKDM
nr:reverse transcriptase domain-containing protein [Tanacetum cinerariifolium]